MQLITSELSWTKAKQIIEKLSPMNKKELMAVLNNFLLHCIEDKDVDELLKILAEQEATGVPVTANMLLAAVLDEEPQMAEVESPRSRDGKYLIDRAPTREEMSLSQGQFDLFFDENFFETYLDPKAHLATASVLIAFAEENGLPVQDHWQYYARPDAPLADEDYL